MSGLAVPVGYAADVVLGDPRRLHPVAGFGHLALAAERAAYAPSRTRGALYATGLVAGAATAAELAARRLGRGPVLAVTLYASLGGRSLTRIGRRIGTALEHGDLETARRLVPSLCGRDPERLDAAGIARATVESLAENTADAVVGPLLWGALAGPAGVVGYRAANTLDAMVGHRNDRYRDFGWAAARIDDVLNWPVARATAALTVVAGGHPARTLSTARTDGARHPSPNAGRVEAAFAGALGVTLGGPLSYGGVTEHRPRLGSGPAPTAATIGHAARLSVRVGAAAAAAAAIARHRRAEQAIAHGNPWAIARSAARSRA